MSVYDFSGSGAGLSRRKFLGVAGRTLASTGLLASFGGIERAMADDMANTSGYRALVCLFLAGGNNGFNTVVPAGDSGFATYSASRRNLALERSTLLGLDGTASDGQSYGLHPSCPELRSLFNDGRMAIISNVGTLVQPTSVLQARNETVALPTHLFSHIDQQTAWWTSIADGRARLGWAGRMADFYNQQGYDPRLAMNISIGGANYWQEGARAIPYSLGAGGAPTLSAYTSSHFRNGRRAELTRGLVERATTDPSLMVREFAAIHNNAADKVSLVNSALNAAGPLQTEFPPVNNDQHLAAQLRQVARCIKARAQLGDSRQIFYVNLGGFDTHNDELSRQQALLGIVSQNIARFWEAINEIGEQNNVTLFTASDFGRGLTSNGDGSDHAWGNHHFVVGGAVRGGYYGKMPSLELDGPDDVGAGRIVPTLSTDQYAATLANWFGVGFDALPGIFPNLVNFSTRNVGFMT